MFEIEIYTNRDNISPIEEYILDLNNRAFNCKNARIALMKITEYIKILEKYGTRAGMPYMKYINDGIWELRPKYIRIFFTYYRDNTFLLLHLYEKKTNKTPQREITKAKKILYNVLERG